MSDINVALALLGGLILALSLGAGLLHRGVRVVSEPMIALAVGVLVGPLGMGLLDPAAWGDEILFVEQAARLTIAIAVTSIALRLPKDYFRRRVRAMATILGPGMIGMWLASAAVVYVVLDLPVWVALLIGAIVTPTDPVLANSIVTGPIAERHIPGRIRRFLSAESGANDGGAYPFVLLAILVLTRPTGVALTEWFTYTLPWEVGGALLLGLAIGALVGWLERWTSERELLDHTSVLTVTITMTFAALGLVKLLGSDGILAVFVAGLAYNRFADPRDEAEAQGFQEVINRLFTYPAFVLIGMVLPWSEWVALGWRGVAVVLGVLLLRRLPMLLVLRRFIDPIDRPAATVFAGWFGPIGIAAVFYAALSVRHTGTRAGWVVGTLIVVGSILAHGVTAVPATLAYDRFTNDANDPGDNGDEDASADADNGGNPTGG
ncbi:cation:proton antiporter domain-containing protein [Halalkalicoccus salilacus]|uniref:cation:proton antiporter domain-containing protein n=1 Tax=Halalkalicoccus TaxID=332246 RepID=UPI002F967836